MPLTRLDNLISSKTGRYLYVSPDDFNASDELDNRGNSPNRPFKTIQRAFLEVARYSYLPGIDNDRFDEFTIMLMPGDHYIDNRPGQSSNSTTPVFSFDQATNSWTDSSVLDLSNSNNVLYQFNGTEGGCVVPRGCSLVGYDLRRTIIRPLYVPDPADREQERTSIFNVTGGAYIWQFTIKDGDSTSKSPLYDSANGVGKVYARKGDFVNLEIPEFSHHKITVFEYAQQSELDLYYQKVAKAFREYQPTIDDPNEFGAKIQETRIVGPLSDLRTIDSIKVTDSSPAGTVSVEVTTKIAHGYIVGQFVAIQENGLDDALNGTFDVTSLDATNRRVFTFELPGTVAGLGLQNNQTYTTGNGLSTNAFVQAEVDSVESASPYMFNLSIRSTWGICGLWANGSKASGFKSMVCAQYTGVSLQKDDRAFIRYDRFTNTWNQASLSDAFATVPYHTKGDAYWKDEWRNFHIRATDDAFVQCVSIFAVGFADHFLMESGGDMSITNSNSNFGNTSLHAIGHKGFAFNQDKGGYISDIIPPERLVESVANLDEIDYYTWDVQASRGTNTRLYFAGSGVTDPKNRPAATLDGYRIGAKSNEKVYVELDPYDSASGRTTPPDSVFNATLNPSGFKSYSTSLQILNPSTVVVDNYAQDAANRIEDNKDFIIEEAYGYITARYPNLSPTLGISRSQIDLPFIVDAVISDLRLGGNINTVQAAEAYFTSGTLNYIDGFVFEVIEGFEYARDLAIAAMRNWDYLQTGCVVTSGSSRVTVPSTNGLFVGMKVEEYLTIGADNTTVVASSLTTSNIPTDTYIRNIIDDTTIELGGIIGGVRSYLTNGVPLNATGTNSNAKLMFKLEDPNGNLRGIWTTETGTVDTSITQDTVYPECSATASAITTFFTNIKTIINNGINPLGDEYVYAHDLLLSNKNWIADVAIKDMLIQYPTFQIPTGQNYFDTFVDAIEAIAYNVKFGSNNEVFDFANAAYFASGNASGEETELLYAYNIAEQIATAVIQNIIYNPRSGVVTTYSQIRDLTLLSTPGANQVQAVVDLVDIVEISIDSAGIVVPSNAGQFAALTKTSPQQTIVPRQNPTTSTTQFANRATLFTVNAGGSNPHLFETGTPVRLVARAKAGRTPDERDIRLPINFQPNRVYYVIAPGRNTQPFNYNQPSVYNGIFDGRDQTKLMLANTRENAAAGIYIYSPETDAIDDDVEILIQQFTLDESYDLHEYRVTFDGSSGTVFKTDVSHIFDKPTTAVAASGQLQKVFFRAEGSDGQVGTLPTLSGQGGTQVSGTTEYYVRYNSDDTFKIFATAQDAITGSPEITLVNNPTQFWYVFANKRVSPMKFDATFVDTSQSRIPAIPDGLWYLQIKDESSNDDNILTRFGQNDYDSASGQIQTTDSYYTRLIDNRDKTDRIYRLRYVQPKDFPGAVRKPNNGFVLKVRTDTKRNLLPQRILLEPVGGAPTKAEFRNPDTTNAAEVIGMSVTAFNAAVQAGTLDKDKIYDPDNNPAIVNTSNYIRFSIRSAREKVVGSQTLLEITAFDHTVDDTNAPQLKNTVFHTVEITSPQAGAFTASKTQSSPTNRVEWTGGSSGFAYIHAYFSVGTRHFLILKDISARPTFDSSVNTRFTQGSVYADQVADVNEGRDRRENFLYVVQGANVFTMTPGDTLNDSVGNTYKIISVTDEPDIDDTFYIFDAEEIQERVAGQQDGIYYLTAVRGNITPFPRGAGVGLNFQNFKFSQPISSLYPLDFKNDPTWYQVIDNNGTKDTLITDPEPTNSFADNYTHGLVFVNDQKRSMTKEAIVDLTESAFFSEFTYTGSNALRALDGNATSGSEQRKIAIAGDAQSVHDQKVYIELRRPSIARSGNHTFEYLGFGPGNYSTGLPARQEVILTEFQDYYAQAKRQDGGIVFYTGLNSNGDLYIGNRKIDAITGEEEFLERAVLLESADDTDAITSLVTSFDTPVTFKDKITVEGVGFFNNRVIINTQPPNESPALTIQSNPRNDGGAEDFTMTRGNFANRNDGDITIDRNKISAALFHVKGRGTAGTPGQEYSIRSNFSYAESIPSNRTPDQNTTFSSSQFVRYYLSSNTDANPQAGDMLFKGQSVERSGSLGWIYANFFTEIPESNILDLVTFGNNVVRIRWSGILTNTDNSIKMAIGKTIRISGFSQPLVNGRWVVTRADQTGPDNDFIEFSVANAITAATYNWDAASQPSAVLARSDENWKEYGVIGSEVLRTNTDNIGEYKLGVNTIARTAHAAHEFGFLSYNSSGTLFDQQEPRANLDVVGTAFISGKTITNANYLAAPGISKVETTQHEAFLVGGSAFNPQANALLRVSTEETRVGVNVSRTELTDTLTVQGTVRLLGSGANMDIDGDLNIDGGDLTTNSGTFNLLPSNALTVNAFNQAVNLNIADNAINDQTINIGTSVTQTGTLNIHTDVTRSIIDIGTVADSLTNTSVITIGGAFSNTANSTLTVKNAQTILDGDLDVNGGDLQSNAQTINLFTRAGAGSVVNFATRASQFAIGGVAGTTEIRNSLRVNGDTELMGDVTMNGGSNSGTVTVTRARLNTAKVAHAQGNLNNLNVDFYRFIADIDGAEIVSSVNSANGTITVADNYFLDGNTVRFTDTTGLSNNVNTTTTYFIVNSNTANGTFQIAGTEGGTPIVITGTPGTGTGITLQNTLVDTGSGTTTWTGNSVDASYNQLPVNNIEGLSIGDILIIGTELVQIVSPGPDINTRLVPVTRGVDCTTVSAHNDNDVIYKLEKSAGATYLVGRVPQNSATPTLSNLQDVTDTVEVPIGELRNGDALTFSNVGGIVGIDTTSTYFVVNAVDDTPGGVTRFNISLDPDGSAVPLSGIVGGAIVNFSDTLVALAEFGGQFSVNDYLRLSPSATCPSGEFVQITAVNDTNSEKFIVNNGANQDRFVIDSIFGGVDSTILGTQDFTINLTGNATTNPTDNQFRIVQGQPIPSTRLTVNSDGKLSIVGFGTETNPKAVIDGQGNQWLSGNLRITNNSAATSVDDADMSFFVQAASGNTEIAGSLSIDDDFAIYSGTTGVQFGTTDVAKFFVDAQSGDTRIGLLTAPLGDGDLTVNGGHVNITSRSTTTPSSTDYALNITQIGVSGNRYYRIRQDAAIDAFGVDKFYNKNGGLRWDFINTDTTLSTGINYIIAISATTVLTLPSSAETGDLIRIIEVSGSLSYNQSLIVRAPSGIAIQGDSTGTNAGGLASQYTGGELIVQTRNAGFGLVYMGNSDGSGATIPQAYRGWWLTEI